jgi:hypothetical protein
MLLMNGCFCTFSELSVCVNMDEKRSKCNPLCGIHYMIKVTLNGIKQRDIGQEAEIS